MVVRVSGEGAARAFAEEGGGHRWQRIPPNERRGRVHTSTITVAVLPDDASARVHIDPADLVWRATRGSGAGGQKRNKTSSAIDLVHTPTGVSVHCETERSQHRNRAIARERLAARLDEVARKETHDMRAQDRRAQVGSGMRGDKRRTVRCQDGTVVDHPTGRSWRLKEYLRGEW
ncbi:MAG: PCRF domain-containing protein [Deltaproteobacteria bacterium]|nr:PCRF domain-containing protein [Deltaproteobacteria bacterium]